MFEQRTVALLTIDVYYTQVLEEVLVGFQYVTLPD